jgi:hypothetical protein
MTITAGIAGSMRRATGPVMGAACFLALVGCAGVTRVPFMSHEQSVAAIPGITGARLWADDPTIGTGRRVVSPLALKQLPVWPHAIHLIIARAREIPSPIRGVMARYTRAAFAAATR